MIRMVCPWWYVEKRFIHCALLFIAISFGIRRSYLAVTYHKMATGTFDLCFLRCMNYTIYTFLNFYLLATVYCAKKSYEPSVAFVCGRGAMHMKSEDSWISDPSSDCIEDKEEILKYCKKVYPNLFVTNIVESSSYQHITGWCSLGKKCIDSQEAFKVRAYRLVGYFTIGRPVSYPSIVSSTVFDSLLCTR